MKVPRHPHTGLATVTWLFTGEVAHRDSAGYEAVVRPGEVNLMVAGRGISHQEFSTPDTDVLHGIQLWFALPSSTRHMAPTFEHYAPPAVQHRGAELRVFLGSLAGVTSPVRTYTPPLLGAEILLPAHARVDLELDAAHEHGVLLDSGEVTVDSSPLPGDHLAYLATGRSTVGLQAGPVPARLLLIGGEPLGEQIVMWWNFIGRDHDEIQAYRAAWQAEIGLEETAAASGAVLNAPSDTHLNPPTHPDTYPDGAPYPRFGHYPGGMPAPLPAPVLPPVRLRPRR